MAIRAEASPSADERMRVCLKIIRFRPSPYRFVDPDRLIVPWVIVPWEAFAASRSRISPLAR
jgi:hypothetical protein